MVLFNNTSTIQVQEIVISITLAINIAAIFIFKDARLSISLTIISAQTLLLIVWGNSIPYIHLITVIPYYLLLNTSLKKHTGKYLFFLILLTCFEIVGFIPIDKSAPTEVGPYNLVIILSLQLLSYKILHEFESLLVTVSKIEFLGFRDLIESTSLNFLQITIANGLYIATISHMLNNLLQKIACGVLPKMREIKIIKLLGSSERTTTTKRLSLSSILSNLDITSRTSFQNVSLPINLAKLLFVILWNIRMNYDKDDFICSIDVRPDYLLVSFQSENSNTAEPSLIDNRNLGTMKQLLNILKLGSIDTDNDVLFKTTLRFTHTSPITPPTNPPNKR